MTDRYHVLVVTLEENLRTDDAQPLIDAILRMRGVLSVQGKVADYNAHVAEERAKYELRQKLWHILR